MREFVKHYEKFFYSGQTATDGYEVFALNAVIEAVRRKRHFHDRDPKSAAEIVKVMLAERAQVPADI